VLFVSHNMAAVKTLCDRGIVLANGQLLHDATQLEAVSFYQTNNDTRSTFEHIGDINAAPGNENIRVMKFIIRSLKGDIISISTGLSFELTFLNSKAGINLDTTFELKNNDETVIFHQGKLLSDNNDAKAGIYIVCGIVPAYLLNAGKYTFKLIFGENQRYLLFGIDDFISFEVENETRGTNSYMAPGVISPNIHYTVKYRTV